MTPAASLRHFVDELTVNLCPECGSDDVEMTEATAPYAECLSCGAEFRP